VWAKKVDAEAHPGQWIDVTLSADAVKASHFAFEFSYGSYASNLKERGASDLFYALGGAHFGVVGTASIMWVSRTANPQSKYPTCNFLIKFKGQAIQHDVFSFPPGVLGYRLYADAYRYAHQLEEAGWKDINHIEKWNEDQLWTADLLAEGSGFNDRVDVRAFGRTILVQP
jgi:hypothetical protein